MSYTRLQRFGELLDYQDHTDKGYWLEIYLLDFQLYHAYWYTNSTNEQPDGILAHVY